MNRMIVVTVTIITTAGILKAWQTSQPITGVIVGAYILLFVLSILDMFGGPLSKIASAIAMITLVYVLLNEFPWNSVINFVQGNNASQVAGSSGAAGGGSSSAG